MRRLLFAALALCLLVGTKAEAAAISPIGTIQTHYCGSSGTSCDTTVSALANVGDGITVCVNNWAGTAGTGQAITINGSSTGITANGTRTAQTNSVVACFKKVLIAGDPGSTIHATWTNNNQSNVVSVIWHPSDNSTITWETPALVGCASTTNCTPTAVTPAQSGDQVFMDCLNTTGSGSWGTTQGLFTRVIDSGIAAGVFGWGSASGTPTMPVSNFGGTADGVCFTDAVAASGAGSVVVATGAEAYNSGSVTISQPTVTGFGHTSDVVFAGVATIGSVQTVYPLPQTGNAASTLAFNGKSATGAFTINAGAAVGSIVVTCAYSGSALTPPAGFTAICSNSANFASECAYKVLVGGDPGATETWTGGSPNTFYVDFANAGGTAWTIDPNSINSNAGCGSSGNANNANAPALNTLSNNEMVLVAANQGGASTVTKPSGTTLAVPTGAPNNNAGGYINITSPGALGTQNFTSTGSNTWEVESIGIIRLTGTSAWTTVGTLANEGQTVGLNVYQQTGLAAASTQTFVTTTGVSLNSKLVNVGGINTSTPNDGTIGTLRLEGLSTNVIAPVFAATANDDLALVFTAFATCGPGSPQQTQLPTNVDFGNRMMADYEPIDFAVTAHIAQSSTCPYASIAIPLQAASAPAQTAASVRLQQQIESIFSLAPAPLPPTNGGWPF
jgi:hypothetical protein